MPYLSQDQTVERKAREFAALELTRSTTGTNHLLCTRSILFGNGVWGEDASKKYFGVSASQLTLDQAATLAGTQDQELYNH